MNVHRRVESSISLECGEAFSLEPCLSELAEEEKRPSCGNIPPCPVESTLVKYVPPRPSRCGLAAPSPLCSSCRSRQQQQPREIPTLFHDSRKNGRHEGRCFQARCHHGPAKHPCAASLLSQGQDGYCFWSWCWHWLANRPCLRRGGCQRGHLVQQQQKGPGPCCRD